MYAIQNKLDGLYWTGKGFDCGAWGNSPASFDSRDEAEAELETATMYGAECRIVELD